MIKKIKLWPPCKNIEIFFHYCRQVNLADDYLQYFGSAAIVRCNWLFDSGQTIMYKFQIKINTKQQSDK